MSDKSPQTVPNASPATAEQNSVAVLPFANISSDKENEYLSDGITEELLNALAKVPGLRVPARTSAFAFKGKNEDIHKIGDMLHVGTVLEGSVRRSGNKLRITAQLINVADGYNLWSEEFDRQMKDVFVIQEEIARAIVAKLKITLAGASTAPLIKPQEDLEAWQLYLEGHFYLQYWSRDSLNKALSCFQKALEKQPKYAQAYADLANAYGHLQFYGYVSPQSVRPLEKAAVMQALNLDDTLAEAHSFLGDIKFAEDWAWAAAEQEYRRALELNPSSADVHFSYAEFLSARRRLEEALAQNIIAQRIDPLNPAIKLQRASFFVTPGQYEKALTACQEYTKLNPTDWQGYELLGMTLFQKKQYTEAISKMETAVRLDPGLRQLSKLGHMYGRVGRKANAQKVLQQLLKLRKNRYVPSYCIADVYEGMGDFEKANLWMNQAIKDRESELVYLKFTAENYHNPANPYLPVWLKKIGFDK